MWLSHGCRRSWKVRGAVGCWLCADECENSLCKAFDGSAADIYDYSGDGVRLQEDAPGYVDELNAVLDPAYPLSACAPEHISASCETP